MVILFVLFRSRNVFSSAKAPETTPVGIKTINLIYNVLDPGQFSFIHRDPGSGQMIVLQLCNDYYLCM